MSARTALPSLLESFFRHRMTTQRNASAATIASYRDGLRLLILFAAERTQRKPCALTVADLDRDLVLAFLDDLETKRQNAAQTRNVRLAAIRSFFRHVAENDPASLGIAQRILAIPLISPRRSASTWAIFTSIRRDRRCSCAARAARSVWYPSPTTWPKR
jgi:integrase/recombinase XerD